MITLQSVLDALDELDVAPNEVPISRAARNYLIGKAQELIDAEEGQGHEKE